MVAQLAIWWRQSIVGAESGFGDGPYDPRRDRGRRRRSLLGVNRAFGRATAPPADCRNATGKAPLTPAAKAIGRLWNPPAPLCCTTVRPVLSEPPNSGGGHAPVQQKKNPWWPAGRRAGRRPDRTRVGENGTGGRGLSRIDGSGTLRNCALRACARAEPACRGRG